MAPSKKQDGSVGTRKATTTLVEKNVGGEENFARAANVSAGLQGVVNEINAVKPRTPEDFVGAQVFTSEYLLRSSKEQIRRAEIHTENLEKEIKREKRRPGYLIGLNKAEVSNLETRLDGAKKLIEQEKQNIEFALEKGEQLYNKAKPTKQKIDALLQDFNEQQATGGSKQGPLNMATVEKTPSGSYVVAANGFPAHLSKDEINDYGSRYGARAHQRAQEDTEKLLWRMKMVRELRSYL